ncbi:glyoxalase-like domain protein [Rhodococcus sp. 06-462-5]|uniref:VOC family protein n=1 Tax=unclassified Rhodococcus (in: high G+C Gram-positive bacteria) TaxID=192944 RepID=UPI000B9BDB58|nr:MULTISPECIES: VOC family protein [unclassified Rhodococcus (in: high G+C Gram-positive bacteria)]OZC77196.1 glyoxalase-like domain protein [Rhodococcus sp. 06-462-5]OZE65489.1 glyoxalase-like domain protein [Rhodococcus sp. 02-925g]
MGYGFQVVVDSATPHALAKWWAQTLGWQVEPIDEDFIREMVAAGHAREEDTITFEGVLVWQAGAGIVDPESPGSPRVLFQSVAEPKSVKNRLHLDIRVGDERETVVAQLEERGASVLHRAHQGPSFWITMTDPEGNEFCVS